ncbi:DUF4328 domain-containing protein [Streptomyces aurantiacus]|uniref:DUF4328 domain-containing protein n=1 Tax=Streptomyces aurantiacus TaxID=47760 RepID=UPI00216B2F4C|nr:DUF4328 domain-containing protein [Streptomyces aurantiacus]
MCEFHTATTSEGYCDVCIQVAAAQATPSPGAPGGRPARLRSPVGLGWAVVVLLGLVILADLYALWAGTVQRGVMDDIIAGEYGAGIQRDLERADSLYDYSGIAQISALVATCAVFLVWFHRVRVNAEVFEPHIHHKTRGWTIGAWFVPVVNFWFPRRIALDIWDASSDRSVALDRTLTLDPTASRAPHPLLNAWWTVWVANLLIARVTYQVYVGAEEAEEIKSALTGVMFSDVLDIAAAVLAIVFVLRLTRMQDLKARSEDRLPVRG